MKPTVIFDVDGVLADFTYGFSSLAVELGYLLQPHSNGAQPSWDWNNAMQPDGRVLTPGEIDHLWTHIRDSKTYWRSLSPLVRQGEIEQMHQLAELANITYLTSRSGDAVFRQTLSWLGDHHLPGGTLLISGDKTEQARELAPHTVGAIDDGPKAIAQLRAGGVEVHIHHALYNQDLDGLRVFSVAEFCDRMLRQLAARRQNGALPA